MPLPNPATRYQHAGAARVTTLASGITAASTSCTLSNSAGWPDGSVGPFFAVLSGGLSNQEKVLCSSRVGDVLNFSGGVAGRGQDGTSAQDHNAGEGNVYPCVSAFEIDLLNAHAAASSQVHGVAGAVLGTTDAQNVTNKSFDNSNNYAGGGLSGTFTGSPTFSGAPAFSGAALFTGDPIFQDALATGIALLAKVSGAGTPQFAVLGDGKLEWGSGAAARDTNLYRSAANVLKTDDALDIQNGGTIAGTWAGAPTFSGAPVFSGVAEFTGVPVFRKVNTTDEVAHFRANADSNPRLDILASGKLEWGSGSAARDTNLFRDAADVLRTNDALTVDGDLTAGANTVKLNKRPRVRAIKGGNQSILDNTYTALTFSGTDDFDSHGIHDPASNSSRITPNKPGLYWFKAQVSFAANSTGHRDARLRLNGATDIHYQQLQSISGVATIVQVSGLVNCNGSTDYVEVEARQNSGGALNVLGGATSDSHFEAIWMADDASSS